MLAIAVTQSKMQAQADRNREQAPSHWLRAGLGLSGRQLAGETRMSSVPRTHMAVDPDGSGITIGSSAVSHPPRQTFNRAAPWDRRTHKAHLTRRPQAPEQWSRSVVDKDRHLRRFDHCRAVLQRPTSSDAEPPFSGSSLMSRHRASHDQAGRGNKQRTRDDYQLWSTLANNSGSVESKIKHDNY